MRKRYDLPHRRELTADLEQVPVCVADEGRRPVVGVVLERDHRLIERVGGLSEAFLRDNVHA